MHAGSVGTQVNLMSEIPGIASLIEGELAQHVALSLYKTGYLTRLYVAKRVPEGKCEIRNAEMRVWIVGVECSHFEFLFLFFGRAE